MKRTAYLDLSISYFHGDINLQELIEGLKKIITISVEKIQTPIDERVILISNHPSAESALHLPAERIAGLKGGNTKNFPDFWFPIVRQMMLQETLQRRFLTVAHDIGWTESMQEMWHTIIRTHGNGRCRDVVNRMEGNDNCSLVIFPEGGARNLETFRTGFFYIACELGIRQLVTGAFSPTLSLERENFFKVLHVENIGPYIDKVIHFANEQRERIREGIPS